MKTLVRLILSIEKLLKNPVSWFDKQPWLLRMILIILIIPSISIVSIVNYQKLSLDNNDETDSQNYCETSNQEIILLRKDLEKFHEFQMEELMHINEDIALLKKTSLNESSSVLGAKDSKEQNNLNQKLEDITTGKTENKLVYIKSDIDKKNNQASIFANSSITSNKLASLEPGSFYPALIEKDDWQQIDLGNNQVGWVKKEFIIKLPINENN